MKAYLISLKPKSVLPLAVVNAVAYIFMLCVNIAADILPINAITTHEISDLYFNLLTPAPYTFVIWGLIYMLLGQYCIYSFGIFSKAAAHKKLVLEVGYLFAVSCVLNALWLIFWHYKLLTASFIIVVLLLADILVSYLIIVRLGCAAGVDKLFVRVPFGIYLGSLITAAAVNGAALYARAAGQEATSQDWTICIIFILLVVYVVFLFKFSSFEPACVGLWVFCGILVRHIIYFGLEYPKIVVASLFSITFLFVSCVIKFIKIFKPMKI